jgi:RimJ/RimL family protein N-acetyltransferase
MPSKLVHQKDKIVSHTLTYFKMITVRLLSKESQSDRADVLRVFLEAPSYIELPEDHPLSESDVENLFHDMPPEIEVAKKSVLGFYAGSNIVGCAEVIRSYPDDDSTWIGLFLFSEMYRGRGYGKEALELVIALACRWDCGRLQLAHLSTNLRGDVFLKREGFKEVRRFTSSKYPAEMIIMERSIA